jgi:CDP-diacylglycerol--glycerol-3-phosphate 3-phosphatidyltransferase
MANAITLIRSMLAFVVVAMLHTQTRNVYLAAAALTVAVFWMDALDGYVARKLGEDSKLGAVVDIIADRIVEMTYWIIFAVFGWVPVWVTLVIAARGFLVDGLRSIALERGMTAFGSSSMNRSKLGVLLVSSRLSRGTYGVAKAAACALVILALTPGLVPASVPGLGAALVTAAWLAIALSVVLCLVRAIPVVVEARRLF